MNGRLEKSWLLSEEHNLLADTQHGFRTGRSCLTQISQYYDEILNNIVNGYETDARYLNYTIAYDNLLPNNNNNNSI